MSGGEYFGDTSVKAADMDELVQFCNIAINGTLQETTQVLMSFETGEVAGVTKIFFPYKTTVNKIRGIVVKAIEATNNGTIQAANATGDMTAGLITATAGDPLNTAYSVSPTANNVIAKDSYVQLTSAKVTAGGKVLVSIEHTRTA